MNTNQMKHVLKAGVKVAACERGQRVVTIDLVALVSAVAIHGVDAMWRQVLARLSITGHTAWRCRALVDVFIVADDTAMHDASMKDASMNNSLVLARDGIVELEALDARDVAPSTGAMFDIDEHALRVSAAMRFLQRHLEHVLEGAVSPRERDAVAFMLQAAQWAM